MILLAHIGGFELHEENDFSRLHIDAAGMTSKELIELARNHPNAVTRVDAEHLWVSTGFITQSASEDTEQLRNGVEQMAQYAAKYGWYNEQTASVRTHIENLGNTENLAPVPPISRLQTPDLTSYRIAVVGLGAQGSGIVRNLHDLGHQVIGAVDIGEKVGQPIGEVVGQPALTSIVSATADELLVGLNAPLDLVIVAATGSRELTIKLMKQYLKHGVNVLTLHQDLFTYEAGWADELHEYCVEHGASAMGTGIQDTWWVQLPAVFAGSSLDIKKVSYNSLLSADQLSAGIHAEIGIGFALDDFRDLVESLKGRPSVMGGPMSEAARRMGLVPGKITHIYEPQVSDERIELSESGTVIEPGKAMGTLETVSFATDRGIDFEGVIQVLPIAPEDARDTLVISGTPDLHIEYRPFPGEELTNNGLISRIPDIVHAAPGLHFAAELGPARHQFNRI